jgi:hypothetical protein
MNSGKNFSSIKQKVLAEKLSVSGSITTTKNLLRQGSNSVKKLK